MCGKANIAKCAVSFGFGLLVAYIYHLYCISRKAAAGRRRRQEDVDDDDDLEQTIRLVALVQRQLNEIRCRLDRAIDRNTAADQIDEDDDEPVNRKREKRMLTKFGADLDSVSTSSSRCSEASFYDTFETGSRHSSCIDGNGCSAEAVRAEDVRSTNGMKSFLDQVDRQLDQNMHSDTNLNAVYAKLDHYRNILSKEANFWWRMAKTTHLRAKSGEFRRNAASTEDAASRATALHYDAFEYAKRALDLDDQNADCHKWYAITIGSLSPFVGVREKISNGAKFKHHLDIAMSMRDDDSTLHHLAGRFAIEILSLSWIERKFAQTLFGASFALPAFSYQDAFDHFSRAYRLKPQWKLNIAYLVQTLIALGDRIEARRYLDIVIAIPGDENEHDDESRELRVKLQELTGLLR